MKSDIFSTHRCAEGVSLAIISNPHNHSGVSQVERLPLSGQGHSRRYRDLLCSASADSLFVRVHCTTTGFSRTGTEWSSFPFVKLQTDGRVKPTLSTKTCRVRRKLFRILTVFSSASFWARVKPSRILPRYDPSLLLSKVKTKQKHNRNEKTFFPH